MNQLFLSQVTYQFDVPVIVFALVIPALLLLLALVIILRRSSNTRPWLNESRAVAKTLEVMSGYGIEQLESVEKSFSAESTERLSPAFAQLKEESSQRYQARWLPDPAEVFNIKSTKLDAKTLEIRPTAALLIACLGFLASAAGLLLNILIGFPVSGLAVTVPALTGLAAGILILIFGLHCNAQLSTALNRLSNQLSARLPVFSDRGGVALLIAQMMDYDRTMQAGLDGFHETSRKLVEGEFTAGIERSVRDVMEQLIAPPIQQSSQSLSDLATALAEKQESGMNVLAEQFTSAVSRELLEQLRPLSEQMAEFNQLMGQTTTYVQTALNAMEITRQENTELNTDIVEALRLMTVAKSDLATEMAEISDNLQIIGTSTDKMTALYASEEAGLSEKINTMASNLATYNQTLEQSLTETARALELASELTTAQQKSSDDFTQRMDRQIRELEKVGQALQTSVNSFTSESTQYISATLSGFESNLAEIVERLTFTTTEIRDAIDALPAAIRTTTKNID